MRDHDWQIFNRVYIGQVISVNPRNGTVSVFIGDGLGSKKDNLEIPVHALSVNGARDSDGTLISAFRSSWIRYMPQEYDLVYVAFGPQNQARILGHATHPGTYKQLVDLKNANSTLYPQELVDRKSVV